MWIVLLNEGAGGVCTELAVRIHDLFHAAGQPVVVRCVSGDGIEAAARVALATPDIRAIIAAGGDGTVSAVAGVLADTGIPLGILPLGTRNHFARDLGLPLALDAAIALAVTAISRRVDVGEVNGRVFVNNSSVGLYPDVIEERSRHRWRRRAGKLFATFRATWRVVRSARRRHVLLATREKGLVRDVPFVFIGNNDYDPRFITGRSRAKLDGGELSLWVPKRGASRRILLQYLLRALVGRLQKAPDLEHALLPELWLDMGKPRVRVATDGEVVRMRAPLHYRVRPGALRVFAPVPEPA